MENIKEAVFISGPMSGLPDYGRTNFKIAEDDLRNRGYECILNPAALPVCMARERYLPITLAMLEASDTVYMLKGWRNSLGATLEHRYAQYQGKNIIEEGCT